MSKYAAFLQLCAILFIVFLCYFLFKYVIYLIKKNRLVDFSLKVKTNKNNPILKTIKNISKIIKKISFIDYKKYNNYARLIKGFDDGYDVISSKILCGIFTLFLYIFVSLLYKNSLNIIIAIAIFILGYVLPDFYYIINSRHNVKLVDKDMLGAIIIMNNDFKANRSVDQAINDVIDRKNGSIAKEFKKVLADTELGLSYGEAFYRMYKRTGISCILDISHAFKLYNMIGSDLIEIFDNIEAKVIDEEKFIIQVKSVSVFNSFFKWLFYILPIFFVVMIFSMNKVYLDLLMETKGIILVILMIVLYIIYVVTINKIVRRYDYDNK